MITISITPVALVTHFLIFLNQKSNKLHDFEFNRSLKKVY